MRQGGPTAITSSGYVWMPEAMKRWSQRATSASPSWRPDHEFCPGKVSVTSEASSHSNSRTSPARSRFMGYEISLFASQDCMGRLRIH